MDAYREEYENYEPELKVWPYILLGFLVPLVPFACNMLLANAGIIESFGFLWNVLNYVVIASSYFIVANIIRTSSASWLLALDGLLHFLIILIFWSYYKLGGIEGYPLAMPFVVAVVPSFIYVLSYAFFAKRSRLPAWGTATIISFISSIGFVAYLYLANGTATALDCFYLVFIVLLSLLSLFTFFVTKRSEATPWYLNIILVLLVICSILVSPGSDELFKSKANPRSVALFVLKTIGTSYMLWTMVSFCFIYAGLGMKSCFKTLKKKNEDKDIEEVVVAPAPSYVPPKTYRQTDSYPNEPFIDNGYAYPSKSRDRFSSKADSYRDDREYRNANRSRYDDYDNPPRRDYSPRPEFSRERDYDSRYYDDRNDRDNRDNHYDSYERPARRRDRDCYEEDYYEERARYDREQTPRRVLSGRPLLDKNPQREAYNRDSYRSSHRRGEEDRWYDLLRGGVDDEDFDGHSDDRDRGR